LRAELLDDGDREQLPVSLNRVMIATFLLVGMDIAHRLIGWLDGWGIDWAQAMVLIAGILAASRGGLPLNRLYIAPHAPVFETPGDDLREVAGFEATYRKLWAGTRAVVDLAGEMFPEFPAYSPGPDTKTTIGSETRTVEDMPAVSAPDDWLSMITRLRMAMEDPRQLLSGAISDYAATMLVAHGNDPAALIVPGLDGEPYPCS
jgi:hypothetical protein